MMDNSRYLTDHGEKGPRPQTQFDAGPKKLRRVALYARESRNCPGLGLEYQLERLRAAAERLGMEVALEASEIVSGFASWLPKRDAIPEQSRQIGFDTVMVLRLDRFGRSLTNMLKAWDALEEARVNFMSLSEGIDYSLPSGKLMARLLAITAEFERDLINKRTRAGINAAASRGVKCGRQGILDDDEVRDIIMALERNEKQAHLARQYNVSQGEIHKIYKRIKHLQQQGADAARIIRLGRQGKLTKGDVRDIMAALERKEKQWDIASRYNVSQGAIYKINRKRKRLAQQGAARPLDCLQSRDHRGNTEKCRLQSAGADAARAQPQASQLL